MPHIFEQVEGVEDVNDVVTMLVQKRDELIIGGEGIAGCRHHLKRVMARLELVNKGA